MKIFQQKKSLPSFPCLAHFICHVGPFIVLTLWLSTARCSPVPALPFLISWLGPQLTKCNASPPPAAMSHRTQGRRAVAGGRCSPEGVEDLLQLGLPSPSSGLLHPQHPMAALPVSGEEDHRRRRGLVTAIAEGIHSWRLVLKDAPWSS